MENESIEVHAYNHDSYIEEVVSSGLDGHGAEMFNSVYYWMQKDDRCEWLQTNYLHDGSTSGVYNTYDNSYIIEMEVN